MHCIPGYSNWNSPEQAPWESDLFLLLWGVGFVKIGRLLYPLYHVWMTVSSFLLLKSYVFMYYCGNTSILFLPSFKQNSEAILLRRQRKNLLHSTFYGSKDLARASGTQEMIIIFCVCLCSSVLCSFSHLFSLPSRKVNEPAFHWVL